MPYAVIELSLHATEHFLRCLDLSPFLWASPSARVLLWCDVFLSDIQEVRSELLQLTARDGHQEDVKTGVAEEIWETTGGHEELLHREGTCELLYIVRCESDWDG
jgi:hypothetical protein